MGPAHDQQRREQILSIHRRHRGRCAGCGQSWPCTERSSVEPPPRRSWRRVLAAALLAGVLAGALVALVVGLADLLAAGGAS